jgi:hypothetical protein
MRRSRAREAARWGLLAAVFLVATIVSGIKWTTELGPVWQSVTGHGARAAPVGSFPLLFALSFVWFAGLSIATLLGLGPARSPADLATDEGGIRFSRRGRRGYIPFSTIRDVKPGTVLGRARIRIEHAAGTETFALSHTIEGSGGVLERILIGVEAARKAPVCPEAFRRNGATLEEWLARIERIVRDTNGYRNASIDVQELEAIARDTRCDPESRAGALYALVARPDPEAFARLRDVLGSESPPQLLAVARLAPGGEALAADAIVEQAIPFLPEADRLAFERRVHHVRVADEDEPPKEPPRVRVAAAQSAPPNGVSGDVVEDAEPVRRIDTPPTR